MNFIYVGLNDDGGKGVFLAVKKQVERILLKKKYECGDSVIVDHLVYSTEEQKFFQLNIRNKEFLIEVLLQQGIWHLMEIKEKR